MKPKTLAPTLVLILFVLTFAYLFIGIVAKQFSRAEVVTPSTIKPDKIKKLLNEDEVEILSNQYRLENGLESLAHDPQLCVFASERLPEVKKDFTHKGFYQASDSFLQKNGYNIVGENVAKDMGQASDALYAWKLSPSHKKNLVSPLYNSTCVRCFESYCVQLFGGK